MHDELSPAWQELTRRGRAVSVAARPAAGRVLRHLMHDPLARSLGGAIIGAAIDLAALDRKRLGFGAGEGQRLYPPTEGDRAALIEVDAARLVKFGELRQSELELGRLIAGRYSVVPVYWLGPPPREGIFDVQDMEDVDWILRSSGEELSAFPNDIDGPQSADASTSVRAAALARQELTWDALLARPASPLSIYDRYTGAIAATVLTGDAVGVTAKSSSDELPGEFRYRYGDLAFEKTNYGIEIYRALERVPSLFAGFYDLGQLADLERGAGLGPHGDGTDLR